MTDEYYIVAIVALMPLISAILVVQKNPYHALVVRGILGAIAALVYALFGAADVALTEALVGTMLSITLYAIAVRSALTVRLGTCCPNENFPSDLPSHFFVPELPTRSEIEHFSEESTAERIIVLIKAQLSPHFLRLELVEYDSPEAAKAALHNKDIHLLMLPTANGTLRYLIQSRVERLHRIIQSAPLPETTQLDLISPAPLNTAMGQLSS